MKTKSNSRPVFSLIMNTAIVVMEITGILVTIPENGISLFRYYTQDSNILAGIASLLCIIFTAASFRKRRDCIPLWVKTLKYIATCCVSVTIIVVLCILAPSKGKGGYHEMLLEGSGLYFHLLCPVAAILTFLLFERHWVPSKKYASYALIPTLIYAAVIITLNIKRVLVGPYIFLHIYEQPVYMTFVWIVVIIGGAYVVARLIRFLNSL